MIQNMLYQKFFKRIIDFTLSLILLIVLFPFVLVFMVLIRAETKGPVFFLQKRLGENGKIFKLIKLRSMYNNNRVNNQQTYLDSIEVTKVGKFIRRFKIDELPQLFNVFIGHMSFVGPRPCLPELQKKFDENGQFRINVKPGLTGLAQINGNIHLTWAERWVFDRKYVENISFILDIFILVKTIEVILIGEKRKGK